MKYLNAILAVCLCAGLLYALNTPLAGLPPVGNLFSPNQGFWQNAVAIDDVIADESLSLIDVRGTVDVVMDERGVPHIFAESARDACYVQGYLTARDRLWQMEFQTHYAAGRLSELIGQNPQVHRLDKIQRRLGMTKAAEVAVKEWEQNSEYFDLIQAYSDGINAYIESLSPADLSIEYKLMNYKPEKWSPYKTALLLKYMSHMLTGYDSDLELTAMRKWLGDERFNLLFPEYFSKQKPIIPSTVSWDSLDDVESSEGINDLGFLDNTTLPIQSIPMPNKNYGSNNWAVSGSKTVSGKPILCNDPHLGLSVPSIWYEIQLNAPGMNVYGVSLPGAPGVIIGFNEDIAWGVTNVGRDVRDWYTIEWKDETKQQYKLDGKWVDTEFRIETIKNRGGEPILDTVKWTYWGPVVYENPQRSNANMAMKWAAHRPSQELATFFKLNVAKNYDDYVEALSHYSCPPQNFVFASKTGDIAIWSNGRFPNKRDQQGRFIQDGTSTANDWQGDIPFEHNPHIKNPESGFVASANQHPTDPSYPYYYSGSFADYRGRAAHKLLSESDRVTAETMKQVQMSSWSFKAADEVPILLSLLGDAELSDREKEIVNQIQNWDYVFDQDSKVPVLYSEFSKNFVYSIVDEILAVKDSISTTWPDNVALYSLAANNPTDQIFDIIETTDKVENAQMLVRAAITKTAKKYPDDHSIPLWWEEKETEIGHLGDDAFSAFAIKPIKSSGHGSALNATKNSWGPSWRMIVELGDYPKAVGVVPAGQSGNPGSPLYNNGVDPWTRGDYFDLNLFQSIDQRSEKDALIKINSAR